MFRKRQAAVADDAIPDDVLASIPDVGTARPSAAPAGEAPRKARKGAARESAAQPAGGAEVDVGGLVAEVRRQMDAVFQRELAKVEDSFSGQMRQMEANLAEARAALQALRGENEQLLVAKKEFERKLQAFKELTRTLDGL